MVIFIAEILPGLSNAPNLHPAAVHFPIVFWVTGMFVWLYALARDSQKAWDFGLLLQVFGVAAAAVAVTFGYLATAKMGHDTPGHDFVHVHRNIMVGTSLYALVVTLLAVWKRHGSTAWKTAMLVLSIILVGALAYGADRGAELVFRYGVGVANETPPSSEHSHSAGSEHGHGDGAHQATEHGRGESEHDEHGGSADHGAHDDSAHPH